MHIRQMLLSSAARIVRSPSDDYGAQDELDDLPDEDADLDGEADEEDDEAPDEGDEPLAAEDDEGDEPPQRRQPSRSQARIERLASERAEERTKREALERELQQVRQHLANQNQGATAQQRAAHLERLDPDQRTEFLLAEQRGQTIGAIQALEFRMADTADKTAFDALCDRNPSAAKLKGEVETQLAAMRANNTTAPRETILRYLIGDRALQRAPQAKGRAEKKAAENKARQTARPVQGRSDVARDTGRRGSEQQARAKRLEGVKI